MSRETKMQDNNGKRFLSVLCASLLLLPCLGFPAASQPASRAPQEAVNPFEAARLAFEALPEQMRKQIQDGLVWTGHYRGGIDGEFGRMTFAAIRAFKQRLGQGGQEAVLSPQDVAALNRAASRARTAAGFRMVRDAATGVAIGIPSRLVTRQRSGPSGTIFEMAKVRARLETFVVGGGGEALKQFYADLRSSRGLKVTYGVLRNDFLVVTGETRSGYVYTRAAAGDASGKPALRGFTLTYPKAQREQFVGLTVAISNSFEPFPGIGSKTVAAAAAATRGDAPPVPAEVLWGSALAMDPDAYLAVLPPKGCSAVRIGKAPGVVLAHDKTSGLALVRAPVGGGVPASVHFATAKPGQTAFVLFAQNTGPVGDPEISLARGDVIGTDKSLRLRAALPAAAAGALVIAADGRAAGLAGYGGLAGARLAGAVPQAMLSVIGSATIAEFVSAAGIRMAPPTAGSSRPGPADVAARYAGAIAPVWCQR